MNDNMLLILAVVAVAVGLASVVYLLLSRFKEAQESRRALSQIDEYTADMVSEREQALAKPFKDRLKEPFVGGLAGIGKRLTPAGYVETTRVKIANSGNPDPAALDRFLMSRVLFLLVIPVAFVVIFFVIGMSGMAAWGLFALFALIGAMGPESSLNEKVKKRQQEIKEKLPDTLDLLVISVEAGLGFEQALDRTISAVPGPLSDELERFLGETRAGVSRAEAMRAMEKRINVDDVRSFVLAFLQADAFGVSIGRVLRSQAEEMRIKRKQEAEERAQKAPVKMLIPMVFCVFPPLFIIVLGPAGISIMETM